MSLLLIGSIPRQFSKPGFSFESEDCYILLLPDDVVSGVSRLFFYHTQRIFQNKQCTGKHILNLKSEERGNISCKVIAKIGGQEDWEDCSGSKVKGHCLLHPLRASQLEDVLAMNPSCD